MLRFLSSTRLTIALCLVLAAVGIAGSFLYGGNTAVEQRGVGGLFHSPLFVVPSFLLLLNVGVCVFSKLRAGAFRGIRAVTFLGLHAGLVLLAAGMIVDGRSSFIGTAYYRVGQPSASHFDWRANADRSFPFTVEVTGFEQWNHPLRLRVGIQDRDGKKIGLVEGREGSRLRVPGTSLSLVPRAFDPDRKELTFDADAGGESAAGLRAGPGGAAAPGGYRIVPVAWGDPEVAGYRVDVRFVRSGHPDATREIRVNRPASFGGITFSLTDTRIDEYGYRIVGLQMTREPGAPWFWAGSVLFGASLLANLSRRYRKRGGAAAPALLLALLSVGLVPSDARAFGRSIPEGETWSGEIRVLEPVTVEKGAVLTIRAGTVVLLSGEARGADGEPAGGIRVLGTLRVEGEPGNPVRFARLDPSKAWDELFLMEATAAIRHAVVEGARWGLHIHDGDVAIERTILRDNGGGARLKGTGARFDRCTIRDNGIGFRFWQGGPLVTASVIERNGVGLFYRDGAGGGKIRGSRIANREHDVKVGDWARGDLDLSGNSWGGGRPKLRDFRPPGAKGKVRLSPSLPRPPARAGAD